MITAFDLELPKFEFRARGPVIAERQDDAGQIGAAARPSDDFLWTSELISVLPEIPGQACPDDDLRRRLFDAEDTCDRLLSANLALIKVSEGLEAALAAANARIAALTPKPEAPPEWVQPSGVSGMGTPRTGSAFKWR